MSIQPVNKAAEHLINSTLVLEKEKEKQSMLIIQRTVGGGGEGVLSQTVGRTGRSIMLQSILCNYFKVCTKFTLAGDE